MSDSVNPTTLMTTVRFIGDQLRDEPRDVPARSASENASGRC
jgi:hypothetical protein